MALPSTREEHKQYCLRKLGKPVIEINVDDNQLEDRIDESLLKLQEFGYDGIERLYTKHQITSTDISNGYITVNSQTIGIVRILPFNLSSHSSSPLFNIRYQTALSDFINNTSVDKITNYVMNREHLNLLHSYLGSSPNLSYTRYANKLYIHCDWSETFTEGDYLIIDEYRILDPSTNTQIYGHDWLLRYTTCLFKEQWGSNLKKYEGIQMPGGMTFNGQQLYDEAIQDKEKLLEELRLTYELPVEFTMG